MTDPTKAFEQFFAESETAEPDRDEVSPVTWIDFDYVGNRKKRYRARVKYTVPNIGDELRISALAGSMVPMQQVDAAGSALSRMIAYLAITCSFDENNPKPAWWDPTRAYDVGPFQELYRRCLEYEARFHGKGEDGGDVHRDRAEGAEDSNGLHRDGEARVGRKVPPPAQRRETLAGDDP